MDYSFNFNINKDPQDTKIVVAMSGGVDSSTVAALLHELGYQVIGITLQLYDLGITLEKKGACCAGQDIYDAKNVADKIGFPHYVLNYESLFKESVIDDFAESYLRGETPIPCVKCNQSVKFRDLLKVARDLGADALATGHYVQKVYNRHAEAELQKAIDHTKDQSYFLFATTKEQLDFTYFPLGHLTKEQTRQQAVRLGLTIADKPDSQDICFVPNGDYSKVIAKHRPEAFKPGKIVDLSGKVVGEHEGIINYTIGQRRGLGISNPEPIYVIKIDPENNEVVVGPNEFLSKTKFKIRDINWLGSKDFANQEGFEAFVKLRSTHKGGFAKITPQSNNEALVEMYQPERAITPGQACVFYNDNQVLGGGWINRD